MTTASNTRDLFSPPRRLPRTPFERSRFAADASRDTIWQGNCDVADLQLRSTIAQISNTIPIQYPISNCPAKKAPFKRLYRKRAGPPCSGTLPSWTRASDKALTFMDNHPLRLGYLSDRQGLAAVLRVTRSAAPTLWCARQAGRACAASRPVGLSYCFFSSGFFSSFFGGAGFGAGGGVWRAGG